MGKRGKKKDEEARREEPELDAPLPETEELPHDRFPPIWRNIYWGQVLFAVVGTLLVQRVMGYAAADEVRSIGGALTLAGLALLAVVFLIYLNNLYRHGLVPDYSLKCRNCNGPVNRYSEFCEHCGADLIAEEKLVACPRCEAEVYEGTKHCPECGAKVGKGGKVKKRPPPGEREPEGGWDTPLGVDNPRPWER